MTSPEAGAGEERKPTPARARFMVVAVCLARGYRAFVLTLLVVALVPMVLSWRGYLVRSGSMEPKISVGDVVVGAPFPAKAKVPLGRVMVFTNPADRSELRVHRVVAAKAHGRYTTKGDANPTADPTPVPRRDFHARAVLLVPYVGLPAMWLAHGEVTLFVVWSIVSIAAFALALEPRASRKPRARRPLRPVGVAGRSLAVIAVGVVVAIATTTATPADAAFTATTVSHGNQWTAAARLVQPCLAPVLADNPYVFYLLDEASGSSSADSSGNSRTGTASAIAAYRQPGATPDCTGYAMALNGNQGRIVSGGTGLANPTTYSLELWFKTTTTAGGKLIGFESTRNASSTGYDREVFMRPDGRLVYYGGPGLLFTLTLTTSAAYNNGAWHHLLLTASPGFLGLSQDATLYVDGVAVASGSVSNPASYSGWWRVGYGNLPSGSGYPSSGNFTGTVDNVAVYQSQLSATRVAAHYAAR